MPAPLFDHHLRAMRRDRASRRGIQTFLYDRAFDECVERLADIRAEFSKVLLAGCPNPAWPGRLAPKQVCVIDPGPLMAAAAGGQCADLESLPFDGGYFDLIISVGLLDTANNLELAAAAANFVLKPGGMLIGATAGGDSLARVRQAMLAADSVGSTASPHVHPRLEAPALARLLSESGFAMPVVDVDRVEIGYRSLADLVRDLRDMGATNILHARSMRHLSRASLSRAQEAFLGGRERVSERLDILHFAAWKAN